jgi:hypothetical protein
VEGRGYQGERALSSLPAASRRVLTGREFFPQLISGPLHQGLMIVFSLAIALAAVAAVASLLRGGPDTRPRRLSDASAAADKQENPDTGKWRRGQDGQ